MTTNQQIWNELVKTNYEINTILIDVSGKKFITLEVHFLKQDDLNEFIQMIFVSKYLTLNSDHYNSSIIITLSCINPQDYFKLLQTIEFPQNINNIGINIPSSTNILSDKPELIGALNLPVKLKTLKIISSVPFDLSNLPNQLTGLYLGSSECKFNLDSLPESLTELELPMKNKFYTRDDLINLPVGLIKISVGYKIYSSVNQIVEQKELKNY